MEKKCPSLMLRQGRQDTERGDTGMAKKLYRFVPERKKNVFLNNLIDFGGNIGKAAAKSGITRQTHYNWLREDGYYASVYHDRIRPMCVSVLEDEAQRRAMGYEEDVYYKGAKVGTVTKYSDKLMEILLKANAPEKYRERIENKITGDEPSSYDWDVGDERKLTKG